MDDDVEAVIQFEYELFRQPPPTADAVAAHLRNGWLNRAQHEGIPQANRNQFRVPGATLEMLEIDREIR